MLVLPAFDWFSIRMELATGYMLLKRAAATGRGVTKAKKARTTILHLDAPSCMHVPCIDRSVCMCVRVNVDRLHCCRQTEKTYYKTNAQLIDESLVLTEYANLTA